MHERRSWLGLNHIQLKLGHRKMYDQDRELSRAWDQVLTWDLGSRSIILWEELGYHPICVKEL